MKLQNLVSRLEKKHHKKLDLSLERTFNLLKKLGSPHDNLENFEVVEDCNTKISASIKYFSYISKVHGIFKTLQFKLDENAPICIQINSNENLSMLYFIAPKTDDNNYENDNDDDDEDELENLENEII